MPALNFQSQFVHAIEDGLKALEGGVLSGKRQTIRALRKDGRDPKKGDLISLYTGMRTKHCRFLGLVRAEFVVDVEIQKNGMLTIEGPGLMTMKLYERLAVLFPDFDVKEGFAKADGFESWENLVEFFKTTHGLPFKGKLIGW